MINININQLIKYNFIMQKEKKNLYIYFLTHTRLATIIFLKSLV